MKLLYGAAGLGVAGLAVKYINPIVGTLHRIPKPRKYELIEVGGLDSTDNRLTPAVTEGPFFFPGPKRSDIREDKEGLRYDLSVQITDENLQPLEGVTVEFWNCDNHGEYSGYVKDLGHKPFKVLQTIDLKHPDGRVGPPTHPDRWLRGAQDTDENGMVHFTTIFPGWYAPRVPHVHFKIYKGQTPFLKTQLYFDEEFCNELYTKHPSYMKYEESPYNFKNDLLLLVMDKPVGIVTKPEKTDEGVSSTFRMVIGDEPDPLAAA